ncbi:MAG: recombination mediator RecR [Candidatus Limnocylindrus sp.]
MSGAPLPRSLERLIEALSRLPGVGPRTAERLAFHILRTPIADAQALAGAISAAREQTRPCEICGHVADEVRCRICLDDSRDLGTLCVVEEPLDLIAIERTGAFRGRYHVLNGALSPMAGVGPGELRTRELFERVAAAEAAGSPIREVIIATNPSPEGDVTLLYLQERLGSSVPMITSMARGLPFGADLQYADAVTILRSLEERRGVE